MNFDDLNHKLERMYSELGATYDTDIGSNIIDEIEQMENGVFEHRVSFGNSDPIKRENMVLHAIHAIAGLKDIINNALALNGKDKKSYEEYISKNIPLQIITDIDNMDKHGKNLSRRRYLEPIKLVNINQAIRGKGISNIVFTTNLVTGKTTLDESSGDVKIVITGDIVSEDGSKLASLGDVLDDSVALIEDFMLQHIRMT